MAHIPDPALRFSHPANAGILAFLRCQAVRGAGSGSSTAGRDGFELHTGPRLAERLCALAEGLPERCDVYLYGCAALAVRGIIFTVTWDPGWLVLRLSQVDGALAVDLGARPELSLGDDWYHIDPWPRPDDIWHRLAESSGWCTLAYRHACVLPDRPFG